MGWLAARLGMEPPLPGPLLPRREGRGGSERRARDRSPAFGECVRRHRVEAVPPRLEVVKERGRRGWDPGEPKNRSCRPETTGRILPSVVRLPGRGGGMLPVRLLSRCPIGVNLTRVGERRFAMVGDWRARSIRPGRAPRGAVREVEVEKLRFDPQAIFDPGNHRMTQPANGIERLRIGRSFGVPPYPPGR